MSDDTSFHTISALSNNRHLAGLLGDLTVAWSHAERVQYFAFWVASGASQSKAFDIYEMLSGPKARLELTLSLFEQDRPDHPKFASLVEKLRSLVACSQFRNELVHRTWVSDEKGNLYLLNHRMSKRVPEARAVDEGQIEQLIRSINSACDEVLPLIMEIYPHAFGPGPQPG